MNVDHLIPILYAEDFGRSVDYFTQKLGFEKLWDWGDPPGFGAVRRDKVEIFVCQGGQGAPGTWLSVFVEDVDALYEEFSKNGATILQPPQNEPWGMREMQVQTPDRHVLRFGRGLPTAPERIIERRDVPVRLETRLASVLEELASKSGRSVGALLEDVVLHSFESPAVAAFDSRDHALIEELKKKHGVDYDTHASYGFVEKKDG